MKENDSQDVIYRYDFSSDTFAIKVNRNFMYDETIEMDEGILLDFDVDNVPTSLEILDASKRFNLPKDCFNNVSCFKMDVYVNKNFISINATIGVIIEDIEKEQIFKSFTGNYSNLPEMSTHLALV